MSEQRPLTLGARIRALRVAQGLTQGELTRGEITPGLISQIESDRVAPSVRVITLLAEQLGFEPSELVSEVELRSEQLQLLRDARDFLEAEDGLSALPLLQRLQQHSVSYIQPMELQLEFAYAKQLVGEEAAAAELYAEVEQYAYGHEDHLLGSNCMNRQGDFYNSQGKISLALFCFHKSLDFAKEINNPPPLLSYTIRRNICICLFRLGNMEQALQFANKAYDELQGSSCAQELADICHIQSVLHVELGESEQALQFAMDAINIYRGLGLEEQLTDAKINHAIVQRELDDHIGALRNLPGIIADYYKQGRITRLANAWTERAACEYKLNQFDDAARSIERSLALSEKGSLEMAEALRINAQILAATERTEEAVHAYEEALAVLTELHMYATSEQVLRLLKELYERRNSHSEAFSCQERICLLRATRKQQYLLTQINA